MLLDPVSVEGGNSNWEQLNAMCKLKVMHKVILKLKNCAISERRQAFRTSGYHKSGAEW